MKILFIFTGGTIGSTTGDEFISLEKGKPYKIIKAYEKKYGIDFSYDTLEPYTLLSENSMGSNMKVLAKTVKDNLDKDYDGIIVTHGTDTLQYSGALLSYVTGLSKVPVCLVSSDKPIENEEANGLYNMDAAVALIREAGKDDSIRGTFVPYRNKDKITYINRGSRMLSSYAYSADMYSVEDKYYGIYDGKKIIKNDSYKEKEDAAEVLSADGFGETSDMILRIEPYPGMVYPAVDEKIKAVILGTYHSGTLPMETEGLKEFLLKLKNKNIDVFITGAREGISYESTKEYKTLNVRIVEDLAPIAVYIKLWMILTMETENKNTLLDRLILTVGGEN